MKLDVTTELYTQEIDLKRDGGQAKMTEVIQVPYPSDLDDWKLFRAIEREEAKKLLNSVSYTSWLGKQQQGEKGKEQLMKHQQFLDEMNKVGAMP